MRNMKVIALALAIALMLLGALPAEATIKYATGFEEPIYTLGALGGQGEGTAGAQMWHTRHDVVVQSGVVQSGTQAVRVGPMVGNTAFAQREMRRLLPVLTDDIHYFDFWWRQPALDSPHTNVHLLATGPFHAFAGISARAGGRIEFWDSGGNMGVDTGLTWTADTWQRMTLALDFAQDQYQVYINLPGDNWIASPVGPVPFGIDMHPDAHRELNQAWFSGPRDTAVHAMYIDDVLLTSVNPIPEPATMILLGLGLGFAGLKGLKKKKA